MHGFHFRRLTWAAGRWALPTLLPLTLLALPADPTQTTGSASKLPPHEASAAAEAPTARVIVLAGTWRFTMGSPEPSFPQTALPPVAFTDLIELPGTTETRGKGPENSARETASLTRVRKFEGPAWYRREVRIPESWAGQRVRLTLERTKYTQVWFDDHPCGSQVLYGTPQVYDLTALARPGSHQLTIMVDNRMERRPMSGQAHQNSDDTQTIWNGILGRIELAAINPVWLDDVQVYSDVARGAFRVRVTIGNSTGAPAAGTVALQAESWNHSGGPHRPAAVRQAIETVGTATTVDIDYPLGPDARRWDEFAPNLYRLTVRLDAGTGHDERTVETGLREFSTRDRQFTINGRTTFLRGKHDACVFPLTGHPPMTVDGWLEYLGTCQAYGINHLRCHTWIPPEAAFAAADRLGIFLQPELPFWGTFDAQVRDSLMPEAEHLLREYGNHPSFVMMTLANEAGGDRGIMNAMVEQLRSLDSRHLYADGSNNVLWDPRLQPANDFWTTAKAITPASNNRLVPARGSFCVLDGNEGHTQWGPAETRSDLREAIAGIPVPVIGHETGQWTTYPDYAEIAKYTGVLRARNLERFQDSLARHGMRDQDRDFFRASGALAARLYQEEVELALRTPGFGGFQLLDLQDYPGQGTALVGMLDAFMDSKGLVTPEDWRRFCSPVVPLARFDRYTWTTGQTYTADLELAHYGPEDLAGAVASWVLARADGAVVARGAFPPAGLKQGGLRSLGRVEAALAGVAAPARLDLSVAVTGGHRQFSNHWPVWVYPENIDTNPPAAVQVVRSFGAAAKQLLAEGRRVVLIPADRNWADTVGGAFATDYWCWPMFNNTPGTMGLLCDPRHPALAGFPTAVSSERQWSAIAQASTPVILSATPAGYRPIVQVIDNLERNEKLGLVFEMKAGPGSLLVCACDLYALQDRPEARQLLSSLLAYAASPAFAPRPSFPVALLDQMLRPSLAQGRPVMASSYFRPPWGAVPTPERVVDGDICTRWIAAEGDAAAWLTVNLGRSRAVDTIELLWEQDEAGYRYLIEGSDDAATWTVLSDQRDNHFTGGRHTLALNTGRIQHVRLTVTGLPAGRHASLRELRVLGE
jgi:hypothetical protein